MRRSSPRAQHGCRSLNKGAKSWNRKPQWGFPKTSFLWAWASVRTEQSFKNSSALQSLMPLVPKILLSQINFYEVRKIPSAFLEIRISQLKGTWQKASINPLLVSQTPLVLLFPQGTPGTLKRQLCVTVERTVCGEMYLYQGQICCLEVVRK